MGMERENVWTLDTGAGDVLGHTAVMPPNHPHYLHIKINCQDLRFMIPLGATWGAV